ncbi:MAG: IS4 family transposase [Actinomycetota bacterium]|nr:IS4 family transposase [Actinomycetota bacterium]
MRAKDAKPTRRVEPIPASKDQVVGRRFMRVIEDELELLHDQHDHPNRTLFFDHFVTAHLLAFFNAAMKSLRTIEDVFEVPAIRRRFDLPRIPKSTLADAQRLFDPALVLPLIESLKKRVKLAPHDTRLDTLTQQLLAVDGTFFAVAPRIAWAIYNSKQTGSVRVHMHFDILRGVPDHATLTAGQDSEGQQLSLALKPNCLYVMDRGFQSYQLFSDIVAAGSDFVGRLRKTACCDVIEHRPLTAEDRAGGVISDTIVSLGERQNRTPDLPPLRRVEVAFVDRNGKAGTLILITSRLDLSASMIALIYQHRWQIELFFRWLKCMACFKHFFSESQSGMTMQIYIAILGTLLIAVATGAKPSCYDYNLMSLAASGMAPIEEVLVVAAKRRAERARAAASARARASKKALR